MAVTINGDGTITGLAEGGVGTAVITSTNIKDATIVAGDIANDTITATQIAANAVTASELADEAVDEAGLLISNSASDGQYLQYKDSSDKLTWATVTTTTNLAYTASTRVLTSDTGTDVTLPEVAAGGDSGLMTGADKTKLDAIEASADVTDATNVNSAGAVMNSDLDGKGELLVGDGSGDPSALAVGTNDYLLTADSDEATGVKWAAAPSSGAALTGSTNNEVVTVTGANAIAGESGLTFDGTHLTITDGDLVIGTSGHGIDFSAVSDSGAASNSELLHEYEEGTWTPQNQDDNDFDAGTSGNYIKIGQHCFICCSVNSGPTGGNHPIANATHIKNFPFTFASVYNGVQQLHWCKNDGNTNITGKIGIMHGNGTAAFFGSTNGTGPIGPGYWGGMSGTYRVHE